MAYYSDGSSDPYRSECTIAIGWLDAQHDFPHGETAPAFLDRLWLFCRFPVKMWRGSHECELCQFNTDIEPHSPPSRGHIVVHHGSEAIELGYTDIAVFAGDGRIFYAPNLIFHYVTQHHYQPPDGFVQAVLTGPFPQTQAYDERVKEMGWRNYDMLVTAG